MAKANKQLNTMIEASLFQKQELSSSPRTVGVSSGSPVKTQLIFPSKVAKWILHCERLPAAVNGPIQHRVESGVTTPGLHHTLHDKGFTMFVLVHCQIEDWDKTLIYIDTKLLQAKKAIFEQYGSMGTLEVVNKFVQHDSVSTCCQSCHCSKVQKSSKKPLKNSPITFIIVAVRRGIAEIRLPFCCSMSFSNFIQNWFI